MTTTRARILRAAERELGRDPDSSLTEIAAAAGVARRTPLRPLRRPGRTGRRARRGRPRRRYCTRSAARTRRPRTTIPPSPWPGSSSTCGRSATATASLIALARHRGLGPEGVSAILAPARDRLAGILARGRRAGVFHTAVPAGVLGAALEAHLLALLGCARRGVWDDDGTGAAVAALDRRGGGRRRRDRGGSALCAARGDGGGAGAGPARRT
ncbi:TetR/AcrR family transcriptional regulator [Streptomyces thinghirensis]|nr:TetR/AcrR family transcriptional regulator [Streptomyces thinghirensis]